MRLIPLSSDNIMSNVSNYGDFNPDADLCQELHNPSECIIENHFCLIQEGVLDYTRESTGRREVEAYFDRQYSDYVIIE